MPEEKASEKEEKLAEAKQSKAAYESWLTRAARSCETLTSKDLGAVT